MENREHHRIDLTAAERERLQQLAIETRSRPTRGTAAYVADWKFMLRRIGRGEIDLVEREPYTLPAGLVEQAEAVEEQERLEQTRLEQRRRVELHTQQKEVVRKMPLKAVKMEQIPMELEPA